MARCRNHRLQQWLQFFGLPPSSCPSSLAVGFIDMETEEKSESASYESSDGESGSDSEGGVVLRGVCFGITWSLAAAGNDLRVGKELLFSKPKIVVK